MNVEQLEAVVSPLLKMLAQSQPFTGKPQVGIHAIKLVLYLDGSGEIAFDEEYGSNFHNTVKSFNDLSELAGILTEEPK